MRLAPHASSPASLMKASFILLVSLAMILTALHLSVRGAQACQGEIARCSTSFDGVGGNGASERGNISANGRYVVFASTASNLVSGDTNGKQDIFRKDLQTGSIAICSISSLGQANGDSYRPTVSGDGRYVAFDSYATNLVSGDSNGVRDVFVKDMESNGVIRCSTSSSLVQGNGTSIAPYITPNGRYVCFYSSSSDLVSGDGNGKDDVFLKDLQTSILTRCSETSSGVEGNAGSSFPTCTPDGRYVVFQSLATNLVPGDTNGKYDVFRKDLLTKSITICSTSDSSIQGNDDSHDPVVSSDGRYVAFSSYASNLVSSDINGAMDIFRKDLQTLEIIRCSASSAGIGGDGASGGYSSMTPDGRYVFFCNNSTNLVSNDRNGTYDVFRKDLTDSSIIRCSTTYEDTEANGSSYTTSSCISPEGDQVVFYSSASNLVSGDTNGVADVFVKDLSPPSISSISPTTGVTGTEVTIKGARFGPDRATSYVTFGSKKATTYTYWSDTQIKVLVPSGAAGALSVKVVTELGASNTKPFTVKDVPSYFFAEGCTREGFITYLCLQNPNPSAVNVAVTYMVAGGGNQDQNLTLAPNSRLTVSINGVVGPGKDVSVRVVPAEDFIVAERPMYFDYQGQWDGGHCVVGATSPERTLYFAEGCTRDGFDTWLCIQNPNPAQATVDVSYYCADGATVEKKGIPIAANSRFTIPVHENSLGIGRHDNSHGDVSVKLSSSLPVVAERPMYFRYAKTPTERWDGGHCVLGTPSAETTLYFAEGCTRPGFDEWLCIQNPNASPATVDIFYYCGDRQTVEKRGVAIPARSRFTIPVHEDSLGIGRHENPHGDVSIKLQSSLPVVAERPMYFNYQGMWKGGHDVMATAAAHTSWYFAEGTTQGNFDEYITLQNPGNAQANVTITYYRASGGSIPISHVVPPHARATVTVFDATELSRPSDHSTLVTSDQPIIAERPMYFVYDPLNLGWDGGHCVMGYGR